MSDKQKVVILRSGNRLVVEPTTQRILNLLAPLLSYEEVVQLHGYDAMLAAKAKKPTTYTVPWECYTFDHKDRLATSLGFYDKIVDKLYDAGYDVRIRNLFTHPDPTVFEPRWDRIEGEFRYGQKAALKMMFEEETGRIDCAPAWGKGTVIGMYCQGLPRAKIAVVTKRVPVLQQRLFPELCDRLPSVGIYGGGKKIIGRRVMCFTLGSLHHADPDTDAVLVDECHEAAADDAAGKLAMFTHAKFFGFSASHELRIDGKDMRNEALFGPIRLTVTNQTAVKQKMILPTEVIWDNVVMDYDPCAGIKSPVEKKRRAYWANDTRNKVIRKAAREYDDDTQVLINVDTFEHGLYLSKLLPEFFFVYNGASIKPGKLEEYLDLGLIDEDFKLITREQRARWTTKFEQGKIKKAIATTIWNVGVNFTELSVLVRCDGGSSPINSVQIPGRPGRKNGEKTVATVRDFRDQFNVGTRRRAGERSKIYWGEGFKQIYPGGRVEEGSKVRVRPEKKTWHQRGTGRDPGAGPIDVKKRFNLADIPESEREEDA